MRLVFRMKTASVMAENQKALFVPDKKALCFQLLAVEPVMLL
jgi:hypothetical protein